MDVYSSPGEVPAGFGPSAVAIGKFDGVHAGHRAVIAALRAAASARNLLPAAVTFDRNPLSILRPELCPVPLVSNAQKLRLLADSGLAATLMLTFDVATSELSAEEFVHQILVEAMRAKVVMVGSDFRFGAKGSGTIDTLREFGFRWGFDVEVVGDVVLDATGEGSHRASSTWIRQLLSQGRVREATTLLGHLPAIRSVVVHGEARGKSMGYPTANLSPAIEGFIPADGVYAAWLIVDGSRYGAAVSIGNNPTFEGVPDKQVEAHVLDADIDLYDKTVELEFVDYARSMTRFEDVASLVTQMTLDEQHIRGVLGYPPRADAITL